MIGLGAVLVGLAIGLAGDRSGFDKKRALLKKIELERERIREAWRDRMYEIADNEEVFDRERAAYRARDEELDQTANDLDHELRAMARKLKIRFEGLDKYLGPNADADELRDEYCERLEPFEDTVIEIEDFLMNGADRNLSPCQLKFRQARRNAEDLLNEVRGVTRHQNWGLVIRKLQHSRFPDCRKWSVSGNLDRKIRVLREYDELFADFGCPMVWTEDQG